MKKNREILSLNLNILDNKNIYFVSDIHGNYKLFKNIIDSLNLSSNDYLFIIGDVLEKDRDNLLLLDYLIELKKHYNIYILRGNCDEILRRTIEPINVDELLYFVNEVKNSIINEMLEKLNIELNKDNIYEVIKLIKDKFNKYYDFVDSFLDYVILNDKYLLIHGGIDNINDINSLNYFNYLKTDNFLENAKYSKYIRIVGHNPSINYSKTISSNNIIYNFDKNVISIDGGNNVKCFGQINVLKLFNDKFSDTYFDNESYFYAKFSLNYNNDNIISFNSFNNKISNIKDYSKDYYLVNDVCYSPKFLVKNDKVYFSTNYLMSINYNDYISIIYKGDPFYIVKRNGEIGYILKKDVIKYGL